MAYLSVKSDHPVSRGYKGHKLTPKMISFINAYFSDAMFNANRAVELSDYKVTTNLSAQAAELLRHPLIQAEIKRRMDARTERSEVKAEYLINKLMQMIEAEQDRNPGAALRAIELAGKSIALWKERQEISGPDGAAIRHEQTVKESVANFESRIASIAKRNGTDNVVEFPDGRSEGGTST